MKILICGLPGSGKSTLAEPFSKLIGAVWLNADDIKNNYNNTISKFYHMCYLADGVVKAGKIAVCDFECSTQKERDEFNADYTVWMDTIKQDTNMFEPLDEYNYHVAKWFDDTDKQLADIVKDYIKKNK